MRLVIYMFYFLSLRDWYPIGLSVLVSAVVGLASKHVPLWLPHEGVLYWDILCLWQSGLGWCHGKQDGFQPRSILKRGSLALMRVQYGRAWVAYAFAASDIPNQRSQTVACWKTLLYPYSPCLAFLNSLSQIPFSFESNVRSLNRGSRVGAKIALVHATPDCSKA